MAPLSRAAPTAAACLCFCLALGAQDDRIDVDSFRRSLRHAELLQALEVRLDAAEAEAKDALAADLARVRLEAQLLARVAPLDKLTGRRPVQILTRASELPKSAHEELVLARLAFFFGNTAIGEAALGRARDADGNLRKQTDSILAKARGQRVPRGGYFRYRGEWLALADRDYCRALDDALAALDAVGIRDLVPPVAPVADRTNRPAFEKLGDGIGERRMRDAASRICASLADDYATIRTWLQSYAARPRLRAKILAQREALRIVQREAIALIQASTKLDQPRVDEYRKRLREMYDAYRRDVAKDFAPLRRVDPRKAWQLRDRLRRREGALAAIDRFFAQARLEPLAAGVVRPSPGSTVTTAHLLPGRRTSGLEDVLWLLVNFKCEQVLDVFQRGAELQRHTKRLTPWERHVVEAMIADSIDLYNARVAVSLDAIERAFVRILNDYRRTLGLRPFELEERLDVCSKKHSQEMVDLGYFGHMSPVPRNRTPTDRARLEGYSGGVGENCLSGSATARGAFEGWYHSPGHHRGMISGGPHLGVGRAAQTMWTMVAGGTDWTWRGLHRDMSPDRHAELVKLVDDYVDLTVRSRIKPGKKVERRLAANHARVRANVPEVLPAVARTAFAAARDFRHRGHSSFPGLLRVLIEAEVDTTWRALQIAAVSASIDAMRFSDRSDVRRQAWDLVRPHLHAKFHFDPDAPDSDLLRVVNSVRKHWEDVAQWRFRAAATAAPPAPRRMAGRADGFSLDAARRMITRRERLRMAKKFGGSGRTEQAVERGLAFLASIQDDDGAWRARSFPMKLPKVQGRAGGGNAEWEIAMTGLSLLAFSSAGYTTEEGKYAEVVAKGARFLAGKLVDYGRFETTASHYMYNHALGTQALCELFSYSADPYLGAAAQLAVDYLVYAQHAASGGWRYESNQSGDTSVTGWVVMALNSAFKARLDVSGLRGAQRFFDGVTQRPYYQVGYTNPYDAGTRGSRLTAVAMTGRLFLGAKRNDSRLVLPAYRMMEDLAAANRIDFYYWYYATLALFQMGEPFWKKWNSALVPVLLAEQDTKSVDGLRGSWTPKGPWAEHGGRIYQTSLAILMLTTYYRYDRAPKVRLYPFTGDIGKAMRPYLEAIRDTSDDQRMRIAMRKIVDSFGASLVGPVARIIRDGKQDLKYRQRLASLLGDVAERRHAGILTSLMATDDQQILVSVLHAFVASSSRNSTTALMHHLGSKHRNVRAFCAQSLGRLGGASAVAAINKRLAVERDNWVKGELQKALHELTRRSRLRELLDRALPADAEGYLSVAEGLAPLERDGLVEFVFALERSDAKLFERALDTIAEQRGGATVPLLFVLMDSPDLDARTRSMKLLRGITRKNFGFAPKGSTIARHDALAAWRKWWKQAAPGFHEP